MAAHGGKVYLYFGAHQNARQNMFFPRVNPGDTLSYPLPLTLMQATDLRKKSPESASSLYNCRGEGWGGGLHPGLSHPPPLRQVARKPHPRSKPDRSIRRNRDIRDIILKL